MTPMDHSLFVVVSRAAAAMVAAGSRQPVADRHRAPMPDDTGNRIA